MEKIYLEDFSGCFYTKSGFINNYCTCLPIKLTFFPGINVLYGDVDQGGGGISYAMSMMGKNKKDILLDQSSKIYIDDKMCTWKDINMLSCYIDTNYHLFQKNITIEKITGFMINKKYYRNFWFQSHGIQYIWGGNRNDNKYK